MDESRKIRNKLLVFSLILLVVLIGGIVLLYFVSKKQSALEGADSAVRLSAQTGFNCEFAEAQKLYPFSEGVMKVTTDRVAYLTSSGSEVYSYSVSYQNPDCKVLSDIALVADIDGYSFSIANKDGMVFQKSTSDKIKSCYLSSDGMCAVITDDSNGAYGHVLVYSGMGDFICDWISYDSGYPISCCFSSDSEYLSVSTVNTNGADFESFVKVFKITNDDGKYVASDYAVYADTNNNVLSAVLSCGPKFFAFSSDSIFMINDNTMSELALNCGSYNYVFTVDDHLFVIYSDGVGQVYKLMIIDSDNRTLYDSAIGSSINAYGVYGNRCIISVDNRVYVFNTSGDILSDIMVDEDILRVGFVSNDKYLIVSTGGVHTYNF